MGKNKKIVAVILAIIIIVGIIVVAVKGFNVSLYLKDHVVLSYTFDQTFEKKDVKEICKEVFGDKDFDVRMVEVFDDSVYIISEIITEEEQEQLVEKLAALYSADDEEIAESSEEVVVTEETTTEESSEENIETEETEEEESTEESTETETTEDVTLEEGVDYYIYSDSNVNLYDLLKPYILPTVVSAILIILCMMIRYRILKSEKVIKKTLIIIAESVVLLLVLLSLIAILRIPVNTWIFPCLMFLILIYIISKFEIEIRKKSKEE